MSEPIHILLVEDTPTDAELAQREILKVLPNAVFQCVETREDYLNALHAFLPELIVSDFKLPSFDGLMALKLVLEQAPDTPLIILTGSMNEDTAVLCMKSGAVDYVIKEHVRRLGPAVMNALEQKQERVEKKWVQAELDEKQHFIERVTQTVPMVIFIFDFMLQRNVFTNKSIADLLGFAPGEIDETGSPPFAERIHPEDAKIFMDLPNRFIHLADGQVVEYEYRMRSKENQWIWLHARTLVFDRAPDGSVSQVLGSVEDITQRKQSEAERALMTDAVAASLNEIYIFDVDTLLFKSVNTGALKNLGYSLEEMRRLTPLDLKPEFTHAAYQELLDPLLRHEKNAIVFETYHRRADGSTYAVEVHLQLFERESERVFLAIIQDISERKQSEDRIRRQLETITGLYEGASSLSEAVDLDLLAQMVVQRCVEVFGAKLAWLGSAKEDGALPPLANYPPDNPIFKLQGVRWDQSPAGSGPSGRAVRTGLPVVLDPITPESINVFWGEDLVQQKLCTAAALPLISRSRTFGALTLFSDQPGFFSPERMEFFQAYARLAAAALENVRLFQEARLHLSRVQALRAVDQAINANFDPKDTLRVLLSASLTQLGVDAGAVLLLNTQTLRLEYAAGAGFYGNAIQRTQLRLGDGNSGRAALDRRTISIPDLTQSDDISPFAVLKEENFRAYYAAPMIAKGQVVGVLEIYNRTPLQVNREWLEYLEALAAQAAITLDNAQLFQDLQRSNVELRMAYDATIEGWSRAMDLRDRETEGHTQRVTTLTVRLAQRLGISSDEAVAVRRGSLLHDIGKMGVPDAILFKPGPLSDEEWEIMRRHPRYAHEMLSPIDFLRPALDIPYCHHERWDGTGYPRGLKGEEIPLAARIFAVVDVWDALTSDRPYRLAWSHERTLEHIRSQSERHFDPRVVEHFLEVIQEGWE